VAARPPYGLTLISGLTVVLVVADAGRPDWPGTTARSGRTDNHTT
jgi:hypothetical protein